MRAPHYSWHGTHADRRPAACFTTTKLNKPPFYHLFSAQLAPAFAYSLILLSLVTIYPQTGSNSFLVLAQNTTTTTEPQQQVPGTSTPVAPATTTTTSPSAPNATSITTTPGVPVATSTTTASTSPTTTIKFDLPTTTPTALTTLSSVPTTTTSTTPLVASTVSTVPTTTLAAPTTTTPVAPTTTTIITTSTVPVKSTSTSSPTTTTTITITTTAATTTISSSPSGTVTTESSTKSPSTTTTAAAPATTTTTTTKTLATVIDNVATAGLTQPKTLKFTLTAGKPWKFNLKTNSLSSKHKESELRLYKNVSSNFIIDDDGWFQYNPQQQQFFSRPSLSIPPRKYFFVLRPAGVDFEADGGGTSSDDVVANIVVELIRPLTQASLSHPSPTTTAMPLEISAIQTATTAVPQVTTATPPETTAMPTVTTVKPPVTTAMPPETTTMLSITTLEPPLTTAMPLETTAMPPVTTAMPKLTTTEPTASTGSLETLASRVNDSMPMVSSVPIESLNSPAETSLNDDLIGVLNDIMDYLVSVAVPVSIIVGIILLISILIALCNLCIKKRKSRQFEVGNRFNFRYGSERKAFLNNSTKPVISDVDQGSISTIGTPKRQLFTPIKSSAGDKNTHYVQMSLLSSSTDSRQHTNVTSPSKNSKLDRDTEAGYSRVE